MGGTKPPKILSPLSLHRFLDTKVFKPEFFLLVMLFQRNRTPALTAGYIMVALCAMCNASSGFGTSNSELTEPQRATLEAIEDGCQEYSAFDPIPKLIHSFLPRPMDTPRDDEYLWILKCKYGPGRTAYSTIRTRQIRTHGENWATIPFVEYLKTPAVVANGLEVSGFKWHDKDHGNYFCLPKESRVKFVHFSARPALWFERHDRDSCEGKLQGVPRSEFWWASRQDPKCTCAKWSTKKRLLAMKARGHLTQE